MALIGDPRDPGWAFDPARRSIAMHTVWTWLVRGPIRKVSVLGAVVTGAVGVAALWGWVDADTADRLLQTWAIIGPIGVAVGAFVATSKTTPVDDPALTPDQAEKAYTRTHDLDHYNDDELT